MQRRTTNLQCQGSTFRCAICLRFHCFVCVGPLATSVVIGLVLDFEKLSNCRRRGLAVTFMATAWKADSPCTYIYMIEIFEDQHGNSLELHVVPQPIATMDTEYELQVITESD